MIEYPLADLMQKADCRYTLCVMVSKRARMLTENKQVSSLDDYDPEDIATTPVEVAVKEVMEGRVTYLKGNAESRHKADAIHMQKQFENAFLDEQEEEIDQE